MKSFRLTSEFFSRSFTDKAIALQTQIESLQNILVLSLVNNQNERNAQLLANLQTNIIIPFNQLIDRFEKNKNIIETAQVDLAKELRALTEATVNTTRELRLANLLAKPINPYSETPTKLKPIALSSTPISLTLKNRSS